MGILRCGFVTVYLSDSLVRAFTTGAAFHVLTSQVPSALGIHVPGRSVDEKLPEIIYVSMDFNSITFVNIDSICQFNARPSCKAALS